MISVFSFPDGSSLVNKVWSPSISLSSLYRIDNNLHLIEEDVFSATLDQQLSNAVGSYSIDVQTGEIIESRVGCSGSFNLFLGSERLTLCFTTERVSHVYVSTSFNIKSLDLLPRLDPSLLATDYYGLSRGVRPLSILCFDDFKVALYNDIGAGLDLKCNYVLMQDEQEIGYFGASLSGGTLNPIPVTAKGLRKYLLSQGSRRIPIKSDINKALYTQNCGVVRTSAAVTKACEFFEDIRAGNTVSTGSWMNLVFMPDQNFFSRPSASLVGVRACNSESAPLAEEIILEASIDSTCFSKLAACVRIALQDGHKLANTQVIMLLIINSNEFDSLVDRLRLQKETFKCEVDTALTNLVKTAQAAIKLELDKPWTFSVEPTIQFPRGAPLVDIGTPFEELCAENYISNRRGSSKKISFKIEMPSLSQCFTFPTITKNTRESALLKFGALYDVKVPSFPDGSTTDELISGVDGLVSVANARSRVKEKVESFVKNKVETAVASKLENIAKVLKVSRNATMNPTCNGNAATAVGWMSKFRIGPFPGEWHVDVSMPDYALYAEHNLEPKGREQSLSGGGLWTYAGPSSYSFPLSRYEHEFPIADKYTKGDILGKIKNILSTRGETGLKDAWAALWVPSFLYNPRVSVVSAEKRNIQLELHFGFAGCPAPVLSTECTNINSLNSNLLESMVAQIEGAIIKPAGSSFDYCVLDHHEDKSFGSQLGSWFDTRQRTVHVGYRRQTDVSYDKISYVKDGQSTTIKVEKATRKEWVDPYAVSPYFYYDVIVPINVALNDLDKEFMADDTQAAKISNMLDAVSNQAELLANLTNLKEIVNLMAQTNNYEELKLLGATEKSLLNPEMAACFTDLNVSDSSRLCGALLASLTDLQKNWGNIFEPGSPGAANSESECYKKLVGIIKHLSAALKTFSCENPPTFFSASQVKDATKIFDGGSINLLLV